MKELGKFGKNAEIVFLPDYKTWQKNYTKIKKNLTIINNVSKKPRALGLTAHGPIKQN